MARRYRKRSDDSLDLISFCVLCAIFYIVSIIMKYLWIIIFSLILIFIYLIMRYIYDLDLKSNLKKPLVYYKGRSNENWLKILELDKVKNEKRINSLKRGINGENNILYSLEHSGIPMYIMHDLVLEHNGYKSQIDFVVVTKRNIYFIESKNLYGNIDVEYDGTIVRKLGKYKNSIKNPLTQNDEHQLVISEIFKSEKLKDKYRFWVVFSNDNSYINLKKTSDEYKNSIMRNDKLVDNINKSEKKVHLKRKEEGIKLLCDILLKYKIEDANIREDEEMMVD